MVRHILLGSALTASFILTGCGSSDSSSTSTGTSSTGYFVDAAVANLDYDCVTDGTSGQTDASGAFTCQNMNRVRFRVGNLVLGEINTLPQDGYVMPQDVVGVPRDDVTNPQVTAMAQLLQSLDADADPANGITLTQETQAAMPTETFNSSNVNTYMNAASLTPAHIKTQAQAQEHLRATTQSMNGTTSTTTTQTVSTTTASTATSTLTPEVADAISYMVSEERLAYDVYMNLYNYHMANGVDIPQLQNIATNAEVQHMAAVDDLAIKYNIPVPDLPSGQYDIPEIQSLYDTLYNQGVTSKQSALETGCMIEVTDVNDLNADIALAEAGGASDVISVFNFLRDGSYSHYWSFDQGLKNMGVADGCCSLGTAYCHPEYPQNEQGNGGSGNANGGNGGGGNGHGRR